MIRIGSWAYVGVFGASLLLSFVLTPLAVRFAMRNEVLDEPGGHKSHTSAVPYLGGVAIVLAFVVGVGIAAFFGPRLPGGPGELLLILGLAAGLSVVGLVDDLFDMSPYLKLLAQLASAVALWAGGVQVQLFRGDILDAVITVVWVVGVTNAFNLLDNMDGLSAGVATISASFFFLLAVLNGQFLVAALAVGLIGCALGFLRHNFHPATIYMGDAGSLFLGFMLAVLGIKLRFAGPTQVTFFVPILVLGVALFDTSLVTFTRILHGHSPFRAGQDHVSHRLVHVGIPVPAAVSLIYAAGVATGWLAVVMTRVDQVTGVILMAFVLTIATFAGTLLGLVPVYDNSKRQRIMLQTVQSHEGPHRHSQEPTSLREAQPDEGEIRAGARGPSTPAG